MTTIISNTKHGEALGTACGFVIGIALGSYLSDLSIGAALGLALGGAVAMTVEYRKKKRTLLWPVIGYLTFAWILALVVIERR